MPLYYNYAKKPIFALPNKALFCKMYLTKNRLILKKYANNQHQSQKYRRIHGYTY